MQRIISRILLGVGVLIVFIILFLGVIFNTNFLVNQMEEEEEAQYFKKISKISPSSKELSYPSDSIKVMSWNIKFGGGRIDFFFDCYGDRVIMEKGEVLQNLAGLRKKILQVCPDILLVQEIDLEAKRSAYINMVNWMLENTYFQYAVYASQWDVKYLPSRGLGRINSGIAIFSRFPLTEAKRYPLPLLPEQDFITRFFYLRRCILSCKIKGPVPQKDIYILNTHLAAYDKSGTRKKQLQILFDLAKQFATKGILIFGGDLNTLPPGTKKVKNFDDSVCKDQDFVEDDYSYEKEVLVPFYTHFKECIPLEVYHQNEKKFYSHTVNGRGFWNRRLDYLFSNYPWQNGLVHQDESTGGMATMPLSDHAPITATLILKEK
ncbi:MAG: endonuclease/exonuclease/phosphatase family protein [Bacteroidia bacterium]|nr:endonuclease/exonuclease/phosphatase family protein [Bacteroidia bacterium]MDW8158591.1 endonuclease/exonuclease/phosphatase family protein [Bacteroidia bacterium]